MNNRNRPQRHWPLLFLLFLSMHIIVPISSSFAISRENAAILSAANIAKPYHKVLESMSEKILTAVRNGDDAKLRSLLWDGSILTEHKEVVLRMVSDRNKETPLQKAYKKWRETNADDEYNPNPNPHVYPMVMDTLLSSGANWDEIKFSQQELVSDRKKWNLKLLNCAAKWGAENLAKNLLSYMALIGDDAFEIFRWGLRDDFTSPLQNAVENNQAGLVKQLLAQPKIALDSFFLHKNKTSSDNAEISSLLADYINSHPEILYRRFHYFVKDMIFSNDVPLSAKTFISEINKANGHVKNSPAMEMEINFYQSMEKETEVGYLLNVAYERWKKEGDAGWENAIDLILNAGATFDKFTASELSAVNKLGHSLLYSAIEKKSKHLIEYLLARPKVSKELLNMHNYASNTPLITAAILGDASIVRQLLAQPEIDVSIINNKGHDARWFAVDKHHDEIVRILDEYTNTRPEVKIKMLYNGLVYAIENADAKSVEQIFASITDPVVKKQLLGMSSGLLKAAYKGWKESRNSEKDIPSAKVIDALLSAGISLDELSPEELIAANQGKDRSLLHGAIRSESKQLLDSILLSPTIRNSLLNAIDNLKQTPLMSALALGNAGIVKQLLAQPGIDISAKSSDGKNLREFAQATKHPEMVSVIDEHLKANPEVQIQLLYESIRKSIKKNNLVELNKLIDEISNPQIRARVLANKKGSADSLFKIAYAKWKSSGNKHEDAILRVKIMDSLLRAGATLDELSAEELLNTKSDYLKQSLLHAAAMSGSEKLTEELLDHPSEVSAWLKERDANGNTVLMWAAADGSSNIVKKLLALPGIDVSAKNSKSGNSNTAKEYAIKHNHPEVVNVLDQYARTSPEIQGKIQYDRIRKVVEKGDLVALNKLIDGISDPQVKAIVFASNTSNAGNTSNNGSVNSLLKIAYKNWQATSVREVDIAWMKIMDTLLRAGATLDDLSAKELTARNELRKRSLLHSAAMSGSEKLADEIFARASVVNALLNERDDGDNTALMWAASTGSSNIVKKLLALPTTDVMAKNRHDCDNSAREYASKHNNIGIVNMLDAYIAKATLHQGIHPRLQKIAATLDEILSSIKTRGEERVAVIQKSYDDTHSTYSGLTLEMKKGCGSDTPVDCKYQGEGVAPNNIEEVCSDFHPFLIKINDQYLHEKGESENEYAQAKKQFDSDLEFLREESKLFSAAGAVGEDEMKRLEQVVIELGELQATGVNSVLKDPNYRDALHANFQKILDVLATKIKELEDRYAFAKIKYVELINKCNQDASLCQDIKPFLVKKYEAIKEGTASFAKQVAFFKEQTKILLAPTAQTLSSANREKAAPITLADVSLAMAATSSGVDALISLSSKQEKLFAELDNHPYMQLARNAKSTQDETTTVPETVVVVPQEVVEPRELVPLEVVAPPVVTAPQAAPIAKAKPKLKRSSSEELADLLSQLPTVPTTPVTPINREKQVTAPARVLAE